MMKKIILGLITIVYIFILSGCNPGPTDCYHMERAGGQTWEGEPCSCRCWYTDDPAAGGSLCAQDCDPGCDATCP